MKWSLRVVFRDDDLYGWSLQHVGCRLKAVQWCLGFDRVSKILCFHVHVDYLNEDGEDEEDVELEYDEEEEMREASARPRRLSEMKIPTKVKPLPKASSFFIFSHTNR